MMIKVFTLNENKKIELTVDELKNLLDDSYWEGYRANNYSYTYSSPQITPNWYATTTAGQTVTLKTNISDGATVCVNTENGTK